MIKGASDKEQVKHAPPEWESKLAVLHIIIVWVMPHLRTHGDVIAHVDHLLTARSDRCL